MNFENKSVLVTGGAGSIGSELVTQLAEAGSYVRVLGHSELSMYNLQQHMAAQVFEHHEPEYVLGSVLDPVALAHAVDGADLVVHAAAHKHVPLCEQNRTAAIINNIEGTWRVLQAAIRNDADYVQVSTDKAVKPSSVMGMTKRAAEHLIIRESALRPHHPLSIVRFGNVMGSSGSVLPLWEKQIADGGPITVTDRRCTRYFMSINEACGLVLEAAHMRQCGAIYYFDMGKPVNIWELAKEKALSAYMAGRGRIEVVETGIRPGEKLAEELHYEGALVATPVEKIMRVFEHPSNIRADAALRAVFAAQAGRESDAMFLLREAVL